MTCATKRTARCLPCHSMTELKQRALTATTTAPRPGSGTSVLLTYDLCRKRFVTPRTVAALNMHCWRGLVDPVTDNKAAS